MGVMTRWSLTENFKADWMVLPNLLTEARGIFSPFACVIYVATATKGWPVALAIFVAVALTDKLDGWIARNWDMMTELGKVLDPIVDKFLVGFTLIGLSVFNPVLWSVTAIILTREVGVAVYLDYMRRRGRRVDVPTSGKVKTVVHGVMMAMWFVPSLSGWLWWLRWDITIAAITLTLSSGYDYVLAFRAAHKSWREQPVVDDAAA